jgi:NhaP-type Na+/H+ or K+/H+ antiporter
MISEYKYNMEPIRFNLFFALFLAGGWIFGRFFSKLRLPSILGMVVFGVGLSLVSKSLAPPLLWDLAPSLKSFALVVILLRAGLSIRKKTLSDVGITALLMSFVPCVIEGAGLTALFRAAFGFPWAVSGLTAFMLAAVSPAVVIPSMLDLKERRRGETHEVPTIIMAGASIDDVFAITLFSVFLGLSVGESASPAVALASVPISIGIGIAAGLVVGFAFSRVFARHYASIRATEKPLLLLVGATLLVDVGDSFHFAALLGVMTAGFVILERHERGGPRIGGKAFQGLGFFRDRAIHPYRVLA